MKFTQVLWKQHVGRMTKRHWFAHGSMMLGDTGAEAALARKGINVTVDANELMTRKPKTLPTYNLDELFANVMIRRKPAKDENHPDWKERPCLHHKTDDLLVQGTNQAQLLTKTLLVSDTLPIEIENLVEDTTKELDKILTGIIRSSNIFDAHQQKLPIIKDPTRPAWIFRRDYGIGQVRKSRNLTTKIIQLCESSCGPAIAQQRQIVHNGAVRLTLEKDGDLLVFDSTMDMMLMSTNGLKPLGSAIDTSKLAFPDIYPLSPTISIHADNFYKPTESHLVTNKSSWNNVHTLFIYHDCLRVRNLTELPVTENQLLARSLMKSFVAAASNAKQKFGDDVKDLPEPITIQCVQTNSQSFHFSVFQLNTLNLDGIDGKCNLWWSMPQINLFEKADYENAIPILTKYNPEVFKRISAFYKNI